MPERYRTIVADPPWPMVWHGGPGGRRRNQTTLGYETMSVEAIKALPVDSLALADAVLFLWVTPQLWRTGVGVEVAKAWGFAVRGEIIWRKPNFGVGHFPRIGHEPCLVAARGYGLMNAPRDVHSVQEWAQDYSNNGGKRHSAKPDAFYDLAEQVGPGPYLEMFARRARFGWSYWGDESLNTAEVA